MANVRDFYMRSESDPLFREDQIEVYDEIEACVNQIRMTLLTRRGEVLGEPDFGLEIEGYLFEFELNPFNLADAAHGQISTYVSESKRRKVTVEPGYTTDERDRKIFALKFSIDGRRNPYAVLYNL
jgi:hypothetical protein